MDSHRQMVGGVNGDGSEGRTSEVQVPILQLAGPWLEEAGFPIGAEVAVEVVEPGSLLVTRVKGEAEAGELLLPLVWIPAEQLGRLDRARAEAAAGG